MGSATPKPAGTVLLDPERRAGVPWWLRIAAKMVLSRLPLPYPWWRRLGIFCHSCLAEGAERDGAGFLSHLANYRRLSPAPLGSLVEIGPGDSIRSALWAKAFGATQIRLIDVGNFATRDPAHYRAVLTAIARLGLDPPALAAPGGVAAVLAATGAVYCTDGLAALTALPAGSVDLIFSQAALEHVRRAEFARLWRESFRVLRPGGVCSHAIDLRDHLGGRLDHLRFAARIWEHPAVAGSGFYTNRLRCSEIGEAARGAGFHVSIANPVRWTSLPTPRRALHRQFQGFSDDELAIAGFTLLLQKPDLEEPYAGIAT